MPAASVASAMGGRFKGVGGVAAYVDRMRTEIVNTRNGSAHTFGNSFQGLLNSGNPDAMADFHMREAHLLDF